jgi:hypothetical protein
MKNALAYYNVVVVNFEVVGFDPDPFLQHVHTLYIRAKIG